MTDSKIITITNSPFNALAFDGGTATVSVNISAPTPVPTQAEHRQAMTQAEMQLVKDQDAIKELGDGIYEALGQFLRIARDIEVSHKSVAELQLKMKETLDEVWAKDAARALRSTAIPETFDFLKTLAANPVMLQVVKKLLGA